MENNVQDAIEQFTKMHDAFLNEWNNAMSTGDTTNLEVMSDNYYVTFFNRNEKQPTFYNRQEAIEGMRQSVNGLIGAKKLFENRIIRQRNTESFIVFYEMIIEQDSRELARFFTIENWRQLEGKWQLVRELEQHI